jgi:iron complex outermembrane receptor protein
MKQVNIQYSYLTQDKDLESHIVSQYAMEYLRHKLVADVQLHIWTKLDMGLYYRWQDRVGSYTDFTGEVHDYKPFGLLDARITWKDQHYSVYAQLNNALNNKDYVDFGNVAQPGAWLVIGANYKLKY